MRYADEQELSFSIERFQGIDQGLEGNDTPMHMSRDAENCDTAGGVLRVAGGWAADTAVLPIVVGGNPVQIRTLMRYHGRDGSGNARTVLLAAADNCIYALINGAWTDIAGAHPVTNGRFSWVNCQMNGGPVIVMANGADAPCHWTGSGAVQRLAVDAPWAAGQPMYDEGGTMLRLSRHGLANGDLVVFYAHKGTLPAGLNGKDTYFVVNSKADTFQVSTAKDGAATKLKSGGKTGWRIARAKWLTNGAFSADAGTNMISAASHGLKPDDEVIFDKFSGTLPGGIEVNKSYFAHDVTADTFRIATGANNPDELVDLTSAGNGDWRARKADLYNFLTGAPSVSLRSGIFTLTNHGLTDGMAVEFGVDPYVLLPGGITAGKTYYVKSAVANSFQICATAGGSAVDILTAELGGWAMRGLNEDEWRETAPTVDPVGNKLTLDSHGFSDGEKVVFGLADESAYLPDGLYAGYKYYAKVVDSGRFKLLSSPGAMTAVDIRSAGLAGWGVKKGAAWLAVPTADPDTDDIVIAGHGLVDGDAVSVGLDPNQMLPGGVLPSKYKVKSVSGDRFELQHLNGDAVTLLHKGIKGWRIRLETGVWPLALPSCNPPDQRITLKGHGFTANAIVEVNVPTVDSFMPGLLAHDGTPDGKYYYVVKATKSTFMVADKPGGTPLAISRAGSAAFRMRPSRQNRPAGGSLALHVDRLWCAGDRARPDSVVFSDNDNPGNWTIGADSAGEIARPSWDGDAVTAVVNLFDSVVVFKQRSMFRVAGTTPGDYQVAPVLSTAGTVSPRTICQWQNAAFFLSPIGIMAFDGMKCERLGGDGMKAFWARINPDREALAGACAAVDGGKLLVALPVDRSAVNNAVVEFDIAQGAFMVRTGVSVAAWLPGEPLRFATGNQVCIWGRNIDGSEAFSYGGQPIPMRWGSPETDFGDRGATKTVTGMLVTGRGGMLGVKVKSEGRESARIVALPVGGGTVKAPVRLRGRTLSFELGNVDGSAVELTGLTVLYEREDDA